MSTTLETPLPNDKRDHGTVEPSSRDKIIKNNSRDNPRFLSMRLRRVSMPANSIQTNYLATGGYSKGSNRLSVASSTSFDSLPEESVEALPHRELSTVRIDQQAPSPSSALHRSLRHPIGKIFDRSEPPFRSYSIPAIPIQRPTPPHRSSLPTFQPGQSKPFYASARSSSNSRASPLGRSATSREGREDGTDKERQRRKGTPAERSSEDRRWRIALELRDTERTYVQVLREIELVSRMRESAEDSRHCRNIPSQD